MKKTRWKKNNPDESGAVIVEATITFPIFIIVVCVIINFINIFTIHNRIQYAMNSAAHEVAAYSYIYEVTGLRAAGQENRRRGEKNVSKINETAGKVMDTMNRFTGLVDDVTDTGGLITNPQLTTQYMEDIQNQLDTIAEDTKGLGDSASTSLSSIKERLSDPKGLAAGAVWILMEEGESALKGIIGKALAEAMTKKYLEVNAVGDNLSADELLIRYGILGGYESLDFSGSTVFADGTQGLNPTDVNTGKGIKAEGDYRLIDFMVSYDVDLSFARLVLFKPSLHIVQRVTVPAWTNGDGKEPTEYGVKWSY